MVRATNTDTADVVLDFVRKEILQPFGPPETILSDNYFCLPATSVDKTMEVHGVQSKTVAEYAAISNGHAERMVGTIKKTISKMTHNEDSTWVQAILQMLYGYRSHLIVGDLYPFQLMYGVIPRL